LATAAAGAVMPSGTIGGAARIVRPATSSTRFAAFESRITPKSMRSSERQSSR
jgi:hypothetical protein